MNIHFNPYISKSPLFHGSRSLATRTLMYCHWSGSHDRLVPAVHLNKEDLASRNTFPYFSGDQRLGKTSFCFQQRLSVLHQTQSLPERNLQLQQRSKPPGMYHCLPTQDKPFKIYRQDTFHPSVLPTQLSYLDPFATPTWSSWMSLLESI